MASAELTVRSALEAPPAAVWAHVTSVKGLNDEFRPWLRMTFPASFREAGLEQAVTGKRLCRSWILLFGLVPIDYDDLTLVRVEPGRGFLERSSMLSQRSWEHERTLEPSGRGCLLTDRIAFTPRLGLPPRLLAPLFGAIFRHRHGRLRRRFGGGPPAAGT